ncbi:unnamed protein product [Ectocarpus sp. 6 AP-2014]
MGDGGNQVAEASAASGVEAAIINGGGDHAVTVAKNTPLLSKCFKRKPLAVVNAEESEGVLERNLGFWDLFALGFGGTVGSGVFVMSGLICHEIAGPAGMFSWMIAGFGCLLSGMSFAELSWRVPSAGGAYAYTFVALGELPAAIVGWCMTLEYGISAAAVAKSWGEMLSVGLSHSVDGGGSAAGDDGDNKAGGLRTLGVVLDMGGVYGALLQAVCVMIVVGGLQASKYTVNTFCVAKALLVVFMTGAAFSLWDADNFIPLAPFGASGVLKGAVAAFFGFLGFDEVVLLAPEAKNPAKHVPRALFASLLGVTIVCAMASVSLSGAESAPNLDPDSAFAEAFRARGMMTAYQITTIGELATLPLVVLVSFMAQPRLLYAMAKDGLLPRVFAEVDSRGTLFKGSLISGGICMITALLVPFDSLNTLISAGVLLAFNFVTSSHLALRSRACQVHPLLVARSEICTDNETTPPPKLASEKKQGREGVMEVLVVNLMACASAGMSLAARYSGHAGGIVFSAFAVIFGAAMCYVVSGLQSHPIALVSDGNFLAPLFPWPQALALWVNWFLVCQLPTEGLLSLLAYVGFAAAQYACYGVSRSVGNCTGWARLLGAASARESPATSRCLSLSADALENALMDAGGAPTADSMSANEGHPLLGCGEGGGRGAGQRPGISIGGGGGDSSEDVATPLIPVVTVLCNDRLKAPAATASHDSLLVRRRSLDSHGLRTAAP